MLKATGRRWYYVAIMNDLSPAWPIRQDRLPYEAKLDVREIAQIDLVVMHCTELPDLAMAREYGERVLYPAGTGNSGHYYIDRDGGVHCYVGPDFVAHHTRGYNPRAIVIELVNTGRYPDWYRSDHQDMNEPYTDMQIRATSALLLQLKTVLPNLQLIAGHEDLDTAEVEASDNPERWVRRKCDPGPHFPWSRILSETGLTRLLPEATA
jgi:N-acetylmuramoyl-L-alanine amidase